MAETHSDSVVQRMISYWRDDQPLFKNLNLLNSGDATQRREAAKELRLLTGYDKSHCATVRNASFVLLTLFTAFSALDQDDPLLDAAVPIIGGLFVVDSGNGKRLPVLGLIGDAVDIGRARISAKSAAAILRLSPGPEPSNGNALEYDVIWGLLALLRCNSDLVPQKEAPSLLLFFCTDQRCRERAVSCGAVALILQRIGDGILVEGWMAVLERLAGVRRAVEEMGAHVKCLIGVLQDKEMSRSSCEDSIALLNAVCRNDTSKLGEVLGPGNEQIIAKLAKDGATAMARLMAAEILDLKARQR